VLSFFSQELFPPGWIHLLKQVLPPRPELCPFPRYVSSSPLWDDAAALVEEWSQLVSSFVANHAFPSNAGDFPPSGFFLFRSARTRKLAPSENPFFLFFGCSPRPLRVRRQFHGLSRTFFFRNGDVGSLFVVIFPYASSQFSDSSPSRKKSFAR